MTGVNTAKALSADEKVVALDGSNPWDSIYLGRLYARASRLRAIRAMLSGSATFPLAMTPLGPAGRHGRYRNAAGIRGLGCLWSLRLLCAGWGRILILEGGEYISLPIYYFDMLFNGEFDVDDADRD